MTPQMKQFLTELADLMEKYRAEFYQLPYNGGGCIEIGHRPDSEEVYISEAFTGIDVRKLID